MPVPTISSVTPADGSSIGGDSIVIAGTNFTGTTAVHFGLVSATSFTVDSPTQITAISPAQAPALVDITVTNGSGTSLTGAFDTFTYVEITSFAPPTGTVGDPIVLTGSGFTNVAAVNFNLADAPTFTVDSDNQITVTVPAGFTSGPIAVFMSDGSYILSSTSFLGTSKTISGSLGASGAGASVFFVETTSGYFSQQGATVIADGSGNFTSGPLVENMTYYVIPVLYGKEFSPFRQSVALATSDITGINWTGSPTSYHLSTEFTDSFNRSGVTQNPIVGWTTFIGDSDLQIVSDAAEATVLSGFVGFPCGAHPTGYTPSTADAFSQFTVVTCGAPQLFANLIRQGATAATAGYQMEGFGGTAPNDSGFQIADTGANAVLFSSPGFADNNNWIYSINPGDKMLILARGNNLYIFQNSIPVGAAQSATTPGIGLSGFSFDTVTAFNLLSVKDYVAGIVAAGAGAYSVPDCRVAPNSSRDVQGTLTYDVPPSFSLKYWFDTLFNRTESLPVDSRVAGAPTDSRTTDNIPTNSRTPGTYGPGE